jgi:hypothetical protein
MVCLEQPLLLQLLLVWNVLLRGIQHIRFALNTKQLWISRHQVDQGVQWAFWLLLQIYSFLEQARTFAKKIEISRLKPPTNKVYALQIGMAAGLPFTFRITGFLHNFLSACALPQTSTKPLRRESPHPLLLLVSSQVTCLSSSTARIPQHHVTNLRKTWWPTQSGASVLIISMTHHVTKSRRT